ncbi:MAG: metallophosphoesterase [Candidatus Diapherotrites archaeon]|nr:metallophosphoesterase [Candidatus Diapherotrites archaeon]MDZ4256858.1 metallophosphoesterase [archaeon]
METEKTSILTPSRENPPREATPASPDISRRKEELIAAADTHGLILHPDAVELLAQQDFHPILAALARDHTFFVSRVHVERKLSHSPAEDTLSNTLESTVSNPRPLATEYSANYKILHHLNYDGASESKGKALDFLQLFQDKYTFLSGELKARGYSPKSLGKIDRLGRDAEFDLVVMVTEHKPTKNGHILLDIEDLDGHAKALIPSNQDELIRKAGRITQDDVIGMKCKRARSGELLIVTDFDWPDLPQRKPKTSEVDLGLLITSDIHIGSKLFLRDWFEKFVGWTNGKVGSPSEQLRVGKLKYLVIAGDCVDGIGVYPSQINELEVKDIYEQYRQFEDYLLSLPEHLEVFITPGNHDPCRWHDPQPPVMKEFLPRLYGMKNFHFLPSPAWVEIEGQKTLIYHGSGLIGTMFALNISPTKPEEAIKELLIKRDLMSVYGTKHPYAPEPKAYMLVREHPDIYIGGDNHYNAYSQYRGTTIVNNGCWQTTSAYAASKGFINTPGRVPQFFFKDATLRESRFDKDAPLPLLEGMP